jgi:hypothetical protein
VRIVVLTETSGPTVKLKEKFVLPSGNAFIESSLLSGQTINLNPFQRLNEAHSEHRFYPLIAWRLRSVGAEAV